MKIRLTVNQRTYLLSLQGNVNTARERARIAQEAVEVAEAPLKGALLCLALDNGAAADIRFDKYVISGAPEQPTLTLCTPEEQVK